nr:hypothetical protein 1 [Paracoccaceae bacterium]
MEQSNFLGDLASAMQELGFSSDVPLEIAIGGTQVYEIEGAGTKWAPKKGTRNYNNDAFIVIRKSRPVISSQKI